MVAGELVSPPFLGLSLKIIAAIFISTDERRNVPILSRRLVPLPPFFNPSIRNFSEFEVEWMVVGFFIVLDLDRG